MHVSDNNLLISFSLSSKPSRLSTLGTKLTNSVRSLKRVRSRKRKHLLSTGQYKISTLLLPALSSGVVVLLEAFQWVRHLRWLKSQQESYRMVLPLLRYNLLLQILLVLTACLSSNRIQIKLKVELLLEVSGWTGPSLKRRRNLRKRKARNKIWELVHLRISLMARTRGIAKNLWVHLSPTQASSLESASKVMLRRDCLLWIQISLGPLINQRLKRLQLGSCRKFQLISIGTRKEVQSSRRSTWVFWIKTLRSTKNRRLSSMKYCLFFATIS